MQITKINTIRNVGRFKQCSPSNKDTFSKFTFIYADNGSGKTTFCDILRSLKTGDDSYLHGRKTLGSDDDIYVSLEIGGKSINYEKGAWSQVVPNIEIFDDAYISENVYAAQGVSHDNKQKLYQIIIGSEGVALAREYERLDGEVRKVAEQGRQQATAIERSLPDGVILKSLENLLCPVDIDEQIASAEKALAAMKASETLKTHSTLQQASIPLVPENLEAVLTETVDGVAKDVSNRVAQHITEHQMHGRGEQWLSEGVRYQTDDCPFCEQSLSTSLFSPILSGFFSEGYNNLKQKVSTLQTQVDTLLGERVVSNLKTSITNNNANFTFWSQYCNIIVSDVDVEALESTLVTLRNEIGQLVQTKSQSVLEATEFTESYNTALSGYLSKVAILETYNQEIAAATAIIMEKKQSLGTADVSAAQLALNKLLTAKNLHHDKLKVDYEQYTAHEDEWQRLDKEKKAAKTALDTYTASVIENYQTAINTLLTSFNAGFRVADTTHDYVGGAPRTSFQIEINGVSVTPGDGTTPLHEPSFKNTLSAGDKSALAFAFFWAQLQSKGDLSNSIIVLDDPFSSQDRNRRHHTVVRIARSPETNIAKQLILLSHDKVFLKDVKSRLADDNTNDLTTFELLTNGSSAAVIQKISLEHELMNQYEKDKFIVQLFVNEMKGEKTAVIRSLRQLLETYLQNKYSEHFSKIEGLGAMVTAMRKIEDIEELIQVADKIDEINTYTRQYHHGGSIEAQPDEIIASELRHYALCTLSII